MNLNDYLGIIALSISIISLVISVYYKSAQKSTISVIKESIKEVESKAESALKTAMGTLELETRKSISQARARVAKSAKDLKETNKKGDEEDIQFSKKLFHEALEDLFNTYERACSLFLDNKIDTARFKKDYIIEIRNLIEDGEYKEKYFPAHTSRFKDILKVYSSWEKK